MAKPLTLLTNHKATFEWTPVHHAAPTNEIHSEHGCIG